MTEYKPVSSVYRNETMEYLMESYLEGIGLMDENDAKIDSPSAMTKSRAKKAYAKGKKQAQFAWTGLADHFFDLLLPRYHAAQTSPTRTETASDDAKPKPATARGKKA